MNIHQGAKVSRTKGEGSALESCHSGVVCKYALERFRVWHMQKLDHLNGFKPWCCRSLLVVRVVKYSDERVVLISVL